MEIVFVIFCAILFTEVVGYFLHRLLHSDKIGWLSRSHMIHHLKDYGPKDAMRKKQYESGARERTAVVGIGMEWIIPSVVIYFFMVVGMALLGVSWWLQIMAVVISGTWAYLMFNYFHGAMHLSDFWMLRAPLLNKWFRTARRRHDIHHKHISSCGKMHTNFGICFFFVDRLFRTLEKNVQPFNGVGYGVALKRYKKIIGDA